ncbi:hypothetical protein PPERSA_12612 [Pseudocohnilembus persalinus]|uniref:Uncharacterized protein n=1 Tax=Pseudocohnilembus persalinus TaxID=266149 RepID=A0A0V0QCK9_PSEPJ|nr:hypothetical protein PPERSA_12612 [Pseudocohnilembus persalinus]|eukprot:KRW99936.1 hypothetical protein PPERSA_12612 [Pseudocohnilembus persalinus]
MLKSYLKFDENFISIYRVYKLVRVYTHIVYILGYRNFSTFISGNSNHDAVYKLQFQNPQFLFKLYIRSLRFSIVNQMITPMDYTPEKFNDSLSEKANNQIKEVVCYSSQNNDNQSSSAGNTPCKKLKNNSDFSFNNKISNTTSIINKNQFREKQ